MKNILIYFPYNSRTVEQQSVMEMLVKKGYQVFLLTLTNEGELHSIVRKFGVQAFASGHEASLRPGSILANARVLIKFCRQYRIDLIFVHQQAAVIPLIFSKLFIKTPFFYVRHNSDEDYITNPFKAALLNKFINRFVQNIIAPSDIVYRYMVDKEKVPAARIQRINYGYNFDQYEKANPQNVKKIREEHACSFLILSIARLVHVKRHKIMFATVKGLLEKGLDVKMICLGTGKDEAELQQWVKENGLEADIIFKGRRQEIFDYLVASDVLFHLSETEASNSVVKETGWAERTAVVCENVGDFSNYITHKENGFLVSKANPLPGSLEVLNLLYHDRALLKSAGEKLHDRVVREFDIKNLSAKYDALLR